MRAIETTAVVLFFALLAFSISNFSISIHFIPLVALCGWLLADLFSGLVHWALDSFGSVRTPVLGSAFIRPFREHHADPVAMTRHDFIEVNGASCLGCLPLLLFSLALPLNEFLHALVACMCIGVLLTNQCHKWAHLEEPSSFVRAIQDTGLVLSAREHVKHHTPPYNSHFCTASGWMNRPLDALLRAFR